MTVKQPDGTELKLGRKDILSLSRAYRQHLVESKEMYLTFPGFSTIRSSLLDLLKMDGVKTGRSYTGRIDGFHHLPFQMDIEAAVDAGVDVYIVPVNIAYERVLEDREFSGADPHARGGREPAEDLHPRHGLHHPPLLRRQAQGQPFDQVRRAAQNRRARR